MNPAIRSHINIEPLHERGENLVAIVTVDSQITKQRGLRVDSLNRMAREVGNESHDFLFDRN